MESENKQNFLDLTENSGSTEIACISTNIYDILPTSETRFFRGRANALYSPVCFSKNSKNINDLVIAMAAKAYIEHGRNTDSFSINVSMKDIALKLDIPWDNKNVYKYAKNYIMELKQYRFGDFTIFDKKTGNIRTAQLITKVDFFNAPQGDEDDFFKNYGAYLTVHIKDPYLLELKGDAAEMDMLFSRKLTSSLSQHIYDYFGYQKFVVILGKEKATTSEMSEYHFRFLFTLNRNDPEIEKIINEPPKEFIGRNEAFYDYICKVAVNYKAGYLKQYEINKSSIPVGEKEDASVKNARKKYNDIYPYDEMKDLAKRIRAACGEISKKTDIIVKFDYAKDYKNEYPLKFTVMANRKNINSLKGEKKIYKKMYEENFPETIVFEKNGLLLSFEDLKALLFEKTGEESVISKIIDEKDVPTESKVEIVKPDRVEVDVNEIDFEDISRIRAEFDKYNGFSSNWSTSYMAKAIKVLISWNSLINRKGEWERLLPYPHGNIANYRCMVECMASMATSKKGTRVSRDGEIVKADEVLKLMNMRYRGEGGEEHSIGMSYHWSKIEFINMFSDLEERYLEACEGPKPPRVPTSYFRAMIWNELTSVGVSNEHD